MLAILIAGLLAGGVPGSTQTPPGDGDVRTWMDFNKTTTFSSLTLLLRGSKGPLPISLVITTTQRKQAKAGTPFDVSLEFVMPRYVGALDPKRPHVVFVRDRGLEAEKTVALNVGPGSVVGVDKVIVPGDQSTLEWLGSAETIDGRLLGVEFVLSAKQVRAIQDFAKRYGLLRKLQGLMTTFLITGGVTGVLFSPPSCFVSTAARASTTSMPFDTWPNIT
jgi:hypothetical protein